MVLGVNKLIINDGAEVVAIGRLPSKGSSCGVIAAAVVCCVLGAGGIAFALWYYKFRPGATGFICRNPFASSKYTSFGATSSAAYAQTITGGSSSGTYGNLHSA